MEVQLVKQMILADNYWALNKTLVKTLGLETAFLVSNFAEAEQMFADKNGWFHQTSKKVEEVTTLSRHKQDQSISELEELGVLEKDVRGIPAKRYFKLNYSRLANLIVNNQQTRVSDNDKLDSQKSATNKELITKEPIYKESTSNSPAKAERIPYKQIIDYLNEKADRGFNSNAKGNQDLIRARWNEGYTLEDFKQAIDNKVAHAKDPNHFFEDQYLTPSTLFRPSNFDKYVNEVVGDSVNREGKSGRLSVRDILNQ